VTAFDDVVRNLDQAMVVVTTVASGERAGCLVGFHAQSSIEPNRYTVWLSKANHTCRVALRATHLGVHFLDRSQRDVAELFGTRSGDEVDKFTLCEWDEGHGGVPLVRAIANRFVGARVAVLDEGGDHVCYVVEPVAVETSGPFEPLRLSHVVDLDAGHEPEERPAPPTERAAR
jgi:flavin reductase (DIM6/NTAB) family NADH-FMN oxidoreductase RutF